MEKLIFVLIDGLRCGMAFRHMGFMEHLLETGMAARYRVKSELPSLSRPLYEVLMTGVRVIEHGIFSNEIRRLSKEENLFGLANKNGIKTAAAAYSWFSELYNKAPFNPFTDRIQKDTALSINNGIFYFSDDYPDSHLVADAESLRAGCNPDFLLVHSMNVDDTGHKYGGESNEYIKSVAAIDYILSNVIPVWLHAGYSIIVTADHGMNKWAIHGGNSDEERMVPLYLLSRFVEPKDYSDIPISQLMIAPLCCKLLQMPKSEKMTALDLPGLKRG